jgi:hypothetical protein
MGIEIPADLFLPHRFRQTLRFAAAVQCPVGGGAFVLALLRGALAKSAEIDYVAHHNLRVSNSTTTFCRLRPVPSSIPKQARSKQLYFLPPANTRFVDRAEFF